MAAAGRLLRRLHADRWLRYQRFHSGCGVWILVPPSPSLSAGGTGCTGLSLRAVLQSGTGHEVPFVATRSGLYAVAPSLLVQGGLQGSYFNNMMLSGTAAHRQIDAGIAFDWGHGQVTTEARDKVSVRWQGVLVDTGLTILSVNSDAGSGVRLWMDEERVGRRASSNTSHGRRAATQNQKRTARRDLAQIGCGLMSRDKTALSAARAALAMPQVIPTSKRGSKQGDKISALSFHSTL